MHGRRRSDNNQSVIIHICVASTPTHFRKLLMAFCERCQTFYGLTFDVLTSTLSYTHTHMLQSSLLLRTYIEIYFRLWCEYVQQAWLSKNKKRLISINAKHTKPVFKRVLRSLKNFYRPNVKCESFRTFKRTGREKFLLRWLM